VRRWSLGPATDHLVWTHGPTGAPLRELPPGALKWMAPHRRALAARTDARQGARWWSLFRTEAAGCAVPRVVWADIGRTLSAAVIPAGDDIVPLNTCYVIRAPDYEDALALAALLNSPLATAWLSTIAEPARGGYRRYMGWTLALLPVPRAWEAARPELAALARRHTAGKGGSVAEHMEIVAAAYGLRRHVVDPLLAWAAP
jgi:hypothetical protein